MEQFGRICDVLCVHADLKKSNCKCLRIEETMPGLKQRTPLNRNKSYDHVVPQFRTMLLDADESQMQMWNTMQPLLCSGQINKGQRRDGFSSADRFQHRLILAVFSTDV